jgi:hypothetical protein
VVGSRRVAGTWLATLERRGVLVHILAAQSSGYGHQVGLAKQATAHPISDNPRSVYALHQETPARPRPTAAARARFEKIEKSDKAIGRIAKSLDAAQQDLTSIGGSLGAGARDMRKDVARLLRDARRDVTKMGKAVRRDLERLQKDVTVAAKPKPSRARPKAKAAAKTKAKAKAKA